MIKLLVVDDHEESLCMVRIMLGNAGFEVITAINGGEALEKTRNESPDVIITDILMPVMDGFALCRELKKDDQLKQIPLIFISTTFVDPADQEFGLSLGAEGFILKTQKADTFIEQLKGLIKKCTGPGYTTVVPDNLEQSYQQEYSQALNRTLQKKITELKEANRSLVKSEKQLRQNEEKFQSIVENVRMGVALIDTDMKVVELNRQMRKWFPEIDYTGNPICYQAFNDPPNDEICNECPVIETFQDGNVHESVIEKLQKNKIRKYRILSSPITDARGKVTAAIEIVEDITERVEIEKKRQQLQKLEAIGTLAGGIAHDFNNILAAINGYTELALDDVEKNSAIEEDLKEIYAAGNRAKKLVNQILLFARESEQEKKPIRIDKIINEVLKFIRSSIPTTIEIIQQINSKSLIMGDPTQAHQIMMNLCTNAAQAMENKGGSLTVTLDDIFLDQALAHSNSGLTPGNYMKLKVSDTGSGISKDIINKIFEPYFTTKSPGGGTGIGLAVVHGIVENYGGKIFVHSEEGKGTSFLIYLPIINNNRSDSRVHEKEGLPMGREHILFVDDEPVIIKIGSRLLRQLGYTVSAVSSSVDALALFRSKPSEFDLIITDMTMPTMSGDVFAAELMKVRPDIPVILCTGYSKKISEESAKKMGIKAFAYKPISKADLAKKIRNVLDDAKH